MIDKISLRATMRDARLSTPASERACADREICRRILSSPYYREADCILLYAAVRGEVDLTEVACDAIARGKTVCYPRVADGGNMDFFPVHSPGELVPGAMHIPEPTGDTPCTHLTERSLMLVPALAYDHMGHRLGWGGGYYDRYLRAYPGVRMGVARAQALLPQLPHESHDERVTLITTELQIYKVEV